MNSFAIGLKYRKGVKDILGDNGEKDKRPRIALHVNIWKVPPRNTFCGSKFYIDFGIKASFLYDRILIYLPFTISTDMGCKDLANKLKAEKVLSALFDTECTRTTDGNSCFDRVTLYDQGDYSKENEIETFFLQALDHNNIKILNPTQDENSATGTWLEIKIVDVPADLKESYPKDLKNIKESEKKKFIEALRNNKFYIRFRVEIANRKQFVIVRKMSNDLIQAAFSRMELYDFRFNESRNLDDVVKKQFKLDQYRLALFEEGDIFYVASSKVLVDNGSVIKSDSRIIEPHIWSAYEPPHKPGSVFIAHHWKVRGRSKNRSDLGNDAKNGNSSSIPTKTSIDLFFTATFPKIQWWTLTAYFTIVVVIGSFGSWLANDNYSCININANSEEECKWYQWLNFKGWLLVCMGLNFLIWTFRRLIVKVEVGFKDA